MRLTWQPSADATSFAQWLAGGIADGCLGERFPETCATVSAVACAWRQRFPPALWARLARDSCSTLLKEAREAVPVIAFVRQRMAELDPQQGPVTLLDLCSGLGFLGMLLVDLLPSERVHACVLMDQAWPLKGTTPRELDTPSKKQRTHLNWDHIYGLPWQSTLTTRRCDLKIPSTHAQILEKVLEPAPGPVFILGVHLCGILSIRAVETFNRGPKCVGLVLKPCCLPPLQYVKSNTHWTLGTHSFAATEVCMWGKYNKNQWCGPVKDTMAPRFRSWASNLYHGILAESKRHDHVPLVEGHYQDTYLMAQRPFDVAPPKLPEAGNDNATLVRHVLDATTADEVLSLPEDASMRAMNRRFVALTKMLSRFEDAEDEGNQNGGVADGAAAFRKVKEAYDTIRAQKRAAMSP